MANLTSKQWWIAAGTRAIKTVAQTALASLGTAAVMSEVNWIAVGSAALLAGVFSLLTSLAGLPELGSDNPEEILEEEEDCNS